jgi:hypothetical protein
MSVKSALVGVSLTAAAKQSSAVSGRSADGLRNTALLQITELERTLDLLTADHPVGDANLAALVSLRGVLG